MARCDVCTNRCVGVCGSRGWLVVERERELKGGGGARCMRWQCQLINTWVWILEVREVTVTLVTSLRREGIREATKTLL